MNKFRNKSLHKLARPRNLFVFIFASLCFVFLSAFSVSAQIISGIVTDEQTAPIENAEVVLNNQTKKILQTTTDAEGKFSFDVDPTQKYFLIVKATGFADFSRDLSENFDQSLTIVLKPASVNEEITVSITKTETRLNETPASIVILNRENLSVTAAQTIDDSLRQVSGFTLFRRGSSKTANPTTQGANLRGIGGSGAARTAVLFDGISLNDAFGGWTYWTRVPKIAVEQAEVLRGGASSLYGSSALSGAINLQTKQSDTSVLRAEISGGTQKTFDGSVFTSFGKKGWYVNFAAESFQTAGYIPIAEEERGLADTKANSRFNNGFLTVERNFENDLKIFGRGNIFKENRDNGTSLTKNRTYFRQAVFGADYANKSFGAFQFRSSIEKQIYDQTFSSVSADRNIENLTRIQRVPSQAVFANLFWSNAFGNHSLAAAADLRNTRGFSDENVIVANRTTSLLSAGGKERRLGFYAQDFWRVTSKLNLNFGARFDNWINHDALSTSRILATNQFSITNFPNRSENHISPRIGAIYQINDNVSILAAYANSFRAPTLNELYRAFRVGNILTMANENLKAENADTFEAGVNFSGFDRRLNIRSNFFVTTVENPVVSVTLTTTPSLITRQRQNVGRTRSRGLEIDAEFSPANKLNFSASYLFADSRVTDFAANANLVGKRLPQIPRQQLTFQARYQPQKKFSLSLQSRFSGAQFEDDLNAFKLRPFFVLDAFASYSLHRQFRIFTAVENVFDNRYDIGLTPNRVTAAPRFVRVGLSFDLQ